MNGLRRRGNGAKPILGHSHRNDVLKRRSETNQEMAKTLFSERENSKSVSGMTVATRVIGANERRTSVNSLILDRKKRIHFQMPLIVTGSVGSPWLRDDRVFFV